MMPFGLKNKNENKSENTPINPTTKSMNEEKEEKTKLLTSLLHKTEGKERSMNKFSNFIKTKEPGWISYHLPGEHTDKMLNIGLGTVLFSMGSAVGALLAGTAGSPIVARGLAFVAFLSMCVGVSIGVIATLR